jgi:hypothetical protein
MAYIQYAVLAIRAAPPLALAGAASSICHILSFGSAQVGGMGADDSSSSSSSSSNSRQARPGGPAALPASERGASEGEGDVEHGGSFPHPTQGQSADASSERHAGDSREEHTTAPNTQAESHGSEHQQGARARHGQTNAVREEEQQQTGEGELDPEELSMMAGIEGSVHEWRRRRAAQVQESGGSGEKRDFEGDGIGHGGIGGSGAQRGDAEERRRSESDGTGSVCRGGDVCEEKGAPAAHN